MSHGRVDEKAQFRHKPKLHLFDKLWICCTDIWNRNCNGLTVKSHNDSDVLDLHLYPHPPFGHIRIVYQATEHRAISIIDQAISNDYSVLRSFYEEGICKFYWRIFRVPIIYTSK